MDKTDIETPSLTLSIKTYPLYTTKFFLLRLLFLILGLINLGIGIVGIILPFLPSFPFFLLTVIFFSQSSKRLHDWFVSTKMYRKNLESFMKKQGMTFKTKCKIVLMVTLIMSIGCIIMGVKGIYLPIYIMAGVWIFHVFYFFVCIKGISEEESQKLAEKAQYEYSLRKNMISKRTTKKGRNYESFFPVEIKEDISSASLTFTDFPLNLAYC